MRTAGVVAGIGIVLVARWGWGQEQHGAIEGRVLDLERRPLAGVTVEASSELGATASTTSDREGSYRFPSLLPGRWEVRASADAGAQAKVEAVELRLGQRLTVDLLVASVAETLEVREYAPLLDLRQSAHSWTIERAAIDKLPRGRTFASVATLAPGVNPEPRNWGLQIDGSSSSENRHLIDGAETTDPVAGGAFLAYALPGNPDGQLLALNDFIEQIQVKTTGYAAEYGGSTGGVLNVLTRSGGNSWLGEALLYYAADELDGDPRPRLELDLFDVSQATYTTRPKDRRDRREPGFSLGGPLVRDELWLFGGYHHSSATAEREVHFLADDVIRTMTSDTILQDSVLNLTAQLAQKVRLRLAGTLQDEETRGFLPLHETGDESTNPIFDSDGFSGRGSLAAVLDYLPSARLLVGGRAGWFRSSLRERTPLFEGLGLVFITPNLGMPGVPEELQRPAFFFTGSSFDFDHDVHERLGAQLDGTTFFAAGGQHQLKAGVQWANNAQDVLAGETGNFFQLFWGQDFAGVQGRFGYYQVFSNPYSPDQGFLYQADVRSENLGLFVQDSYTAFGRLTLNAGLRTETEKIPSYSADPRIPGTAIEFDFGDKVAPRLGFAWDVRGDGRYKLHGDWGLYYDITKLSLPGAYFGGGSGNLYWFTLDDPDWRNIDPPGCPPACPGELIFGPLDLGFAANDPENNLIDPEVEPMRLQEWSLGLEHQITRRLSASVRYLHKQVDVALEDVGALDELGNPVLVIGNPGRGRASLAHKNADGSTVPYPEAERDYDALELALERRTADRWFGRFSYRYSRLAGNHSGLSDSEFLNAGTPNTTRHFDHPFIQFDQTGRPSSGRLATDRPHHFKLHGAYEFAWGTSLGVHWFGSSGLQRTRQADFFSDIGPVPVQYLGRGSDGRLSFLHQTDLFLQHEWKLGDRRRLAVNVNVLNLFDQDEATNYYPYQLFFGQGVFIPGDDFYRGFDAERLIDEQGLFRDPRFLRDTSFQPPRTIRLGLRLSL